MSKKISIYNSTHGPYTSFSSSTMKLIHVGAEGSYYDYGLTLKDNVGINISLKNPFYCELTAQYWAWKNDLSSDYLGFMHYRRHLNFSDKRYQTDLWGCINHTRIDPAYERQFGLDDETISRMVSEYDIILPEKWDVRNAGSQNNLDHYAKGEFLHVEDYETAIDLLREKYHEFIPYAEDFNQSSEGWYTNIFVMKREIFEDYSKWLFDFLEELESRLSIQRYNAQEQRVVGHIAERLFNIYVARLIAENPDIKYKELQRTFVQNVTKKVVFKNEKDGFLPYVICFDNNYSHTAGALIQSIVDNSSDENGYELFLFCDQVTLTNKKRLLSVIDSRENFRIRFVDTSALYDSGQMHTSEHFTAATYARLFIPSVLPDHDRVVFIDSDMIVLDDVAKLHKIDIGEKKLGAVKDLVMEGFIKFEHQTPKVFKGQTAESYLLNYLGMKNPDNYFQAGLLIFDIQKIKSDLVCEKMVKTIYEKRYWYHDQDILNKVFEGEVCYLDIAWNVYHGNGTTERFFPNLKLSSYLSFIESRQRLKAVHFAGDQKPWTNPDVDYADLYFKNVSKTPWASLYIKALPEDLSKRETNEIKGHMLFFLNANPALRLLPEKELISNLFEKIRPVITIDITDSSLKGKIERVLPEIGKYNRLARFMTRKFSSLLVKGRYLFLPMAPVGSARYRILRKVYKVLSGV